MPRHALTLTVVLATAVVCVSVAWAQTNVITTIAGNGTPGPAGDGGPANAAQLSQPVNVSPVPGGGYLIVDQGNSKVRRVDASGTITTVAGTGTPGFSGDNGAATSAQLNAPNAAVMRPASGLLTPSFTVRAPGVRPARVQLAVFRT